MLTHMWGLMCCHGFRSWCVFFFLWQPLPVPSLKASLSPSMRFSHTSHIAAMYLTVSLRSNWDTVNTHSHFRQLAPTSVCVCVCVPLALLPILTTNSAMWNNSVVTCLQGTASPILPFNLTHAHTHTLTRTHTHTHYSLTDISSSHTYTCTDFPTELEEYNEHSTRNYRNGC